MWGAGRRLGFALINLWDLWSYLWWLTAGRRLETGCWLTAWPNIDSWLTAWPNIDTFQKLLVTSGSNTYLAVSTQDLRRLFH